MESGAHEWLLQSEGRSCARDRAELQPVTLPVKGRGFRKGRAQHSTASASGGGGGGEGSCLAHLPGGRSPRALGKLLERPKVSQTSHSLLWRRSHVTPPPPPHPHPTTLRGERIAKGNLYGDREIGSACDSASSDGARESVVVRTRLSRLS